MRRGLADSREQAQAAVEAGRVVVGGAPASKPSRLVDSGEPITLLGDGPRFVSRGGEKLDAALEHFGIDVTGRVALDAGASTGGFTDCLLQRGAAHVTSVDVGHGQFHHRLRTDARVTVLERTNIRTLDPDALGGQRPSIVVADLSFISLRTVASTLVGLAAPGADLVVLIKPQFEAGRAEASKGEGVIRDPAIWARVLRDVRTSFDEQDAVMMGLMVSPLTGPAGNVEFLAQLRAPGGERPDADLGDALVDAAVADASARDGR